MINAERQLIGAWLSGKYQEHVREFEQFDFMDDILQAMKKVKYIDPISVASEMKINPIELFGLSKECYLAMYDGSYRLVKEKNIKELLEKAYMDFDNKDKWLDLIRLEQSRIDNIKPVAPVDMVEAFNEEYERRLSEEVMPYGIADLDYYMGGLRRKELTVIASRPSVGKTALSLQIAYNLGVHKKNKVLFFSLEMAGCQLMERFLCKETDIPHDELKKPKNMTEYNKEKMLTFMDEFRRFDNLIIFDSVNVLSVIQRIIKQHKPDIVFIDQLSKLKENRSFNSIRERFTYMTNELKTLTMTQNISIVLMVQINRDAQNREPTIADLKESGSIEEDADNIIMIHQKEEVERNKQKNIPIALLIKKQRNGVKDLALHTTYKSNKFTFTSDWYKEVEESEAMAWET